MEARVEEIILNVNNQIALSKYDRSQLIGGLIITGGASHMKDIDKAFMRDTKFEKIRFVRNIRVPLRTSDYPGFNSDGDCNAAIALIDKGEMNCSNGELGKADLFNEEEKAAEKEQQLSAEEQAAAEASKKAEEEAAKQLEEERIRQEAEEERLRIEEEKRRKQQRWKNIKKKFSKFGDWFGKIVDENDGDNA